VKYYGAEEFEVNRYKSAVLAYQVCCIIVTMNHCNLFSLIIKFLKRPLNGCSNHIIFIVSCQIFSTVPIAGLPSLT